ncbi:sugar phosphate isomerase/epimerase family protein [Labrys wisconsinensis]|uniref:Sugar phosphate isomerase/epimerase n=1 Tax=Labrys wisconsinensis TaxID=425677 RepID=A0ABU0JKE1_9HYPH|nr:sugar phosphate isomerase/epimerase [Labrys wisconsinensis]MDQ0474757.1 sugar phosphate isomerase/epimerase [Labrys wisconsinensis]
MQLGIFAKTFDAQGAVPVLRAVAEAGYATAQFNLACLGLPSMPDRIEPEVAASVGAAAGQTGVGIAAVSGTYNMIHPDPAVRRAGLARLEVLCAAASAMGTRLVTLCTGTRDAEDQWRWHPDNASPEAWRDLLAEMTAAAALAERHDVELGIEPELANVVSSAVRARRLIDEIDSARLRIVLDPANLFEVAEEDERRTIVARAVDLLAGDIALAHAKDRHADGSFATAGQGVVDFAHFVGRLRAAGFDGPLVTHGLAAAEAPGVATFLQRVIAEAAA